MRNRRGLSSARRSPQRSWRRAPMTAQTRLMRIGTKLSPVSTCRRRSLSSSTWPNVKPFALTSTSQFRPEPPLALKSEQWAADYNEIKELGSKTSSKRSARQTEDARFWLITGPQSTEPVVRQIVAAKKMSLIDSARFMAIDLRGRADAAISRCLMPSITTISGARSPRSATAIPTTILSLNATQPGSPSTIRRCIRNIPVRTASSARRSPATEALSARRTFRKLP